MAPNDPIGLVPLDMAVDKVDDILWQAFRYSSFLLVSDSSSEDPNLQVLNVFAIVMVR